jgi:uncharacterized membrane protein
VASPASGRLLFLDGLRGLALVFMVFNHTARWWIERSMGWPRYHLAYLTIPLAAPIFLFLVGFCLPLSYLNSTVTRGERYASVAWKYVRRGARLVLAGWLLTLLVFPEEPLFGGGVLQTIGLSIIGLTPLMPLFSRRAARWLFLVLAFAIYASFNLAYPAFRGWLTGHPVVAEVWFSDFPLWPWFGFPLLGAVLGWAWTEIRRRGADDRRYFTMMSLASVLCFAAFLVLEFTIGRTPHFHSGRDLVLNGYWTPGAVTCLWILGIIFSLLPAVYYLMQVRQLRAPWLVILGQNALVLYFIHQIIVLTLVRQRLGVVFHSWWLYALANVALLVLLVGLGRLWPEIKQRVKTLSRSSVEGTGVVGSSRRPTSPSGR